MGRSAKARPVVFDREKRIEYLTGFHKRKVERRERALTRQKEEKAEEKRRERAERREARLRQAGLVTLDNGFDEWHGFDDDDNSDNAATKERYVDQEAGMESIVTISGLDGTDLSFRAAQNHEKIFNNELMLQKERRSKVSASKPRPPPTRKKRSR